MKIGDLVRYWKDGTVGLIIGYSFEKGYTVLFSDCELTRIRDDELELVNENR
jgi:uncharacterized protein YcsI (UPF0317 family)